MRQPEPKEVPFVLDLLFYVVAAALVAGAAGGLAWITITAWAWAERSDAERGLPFRMWLRHRR